MDSLPIAHKLEEIHPNPSLHLDSPDFAPVSDLLSKLTGAVRPVFVPLVPKKFLLPRSAEYFVTSREKSVNMPLDVYAQQGDQGFENAKPFVKTLGEWYGEKPEGPFLAGKEVAFTDVMVLGLLRMLDRLGKVERIWEMEGGKALKTCYDASGKWFERDTY